MKLTSGTNRRRVLKDAGATLPARNHLQVPCPALGRHPIGYGVPRVLPPSFAVFAAQGFSYRGLPAQDIPGQTTRNERL